MYLFICVFFSADPHECQTEFRFPTGCVDDACDYIARWVYYESKESVHFEITSRGLGRWTGIGLSRDGNMVSPPPPLFHTVILLLLNLRRTVTCMWDGCTMTLPT